MSGLKVGRHAGGVPQRRAGGRVRRFNGVPGRAELERCFFLDDADRELVRRRRSEQKRLGFALQLTTVRFLGTFLADPLDVPWVVVKYLGRQLDIAGPLVGEGVLRASGDAVGAHRRGSQVYGFTWWPMLAPMTLGLGERANDARNVM